VAKTVVVHLISPSSGELVELLARTVIAQMVDVAAERHLWTMVRGMTQMPDLLAAIAARPGFVLHTLADIQMRQALEDGCRQLDVPCMFVLGPFVEPMAGYFGADVHYRASARDVMDEEYYRRLDAMRFTLAHDDGLGIQDLEDADVVLLGVSRATKTPTCMYLAHRGVRAANVPLVPGVPIPESVMQLKSPLVVGLTIHPATLVKVREERLRMLSQRRRSDYSDVDAVTEEVANVRRMFARRGWPVIDVTSRSIEQTAALIIDMLKKRQAGAGGR
jgi:hypothetical protein